SVAGSSSTRRTMEGRGRAMVARMRRPKRAGCQACGSSDGSVLLSAFRRDEKVRLSDNGGRAPRGREMESGGGARRGSEQLGDGGVLQRASDGAAHPDRRGRAG